MAQTFAERQSALAAQLAQLEKTVNLKQNPTTEIEPMDIEPPRSFKRKYSDIKHLRGRESIFKRPELPISKCLPKRTQPNFKINPHKWKKYTLEDVTSEDMSDRQNTSSAFAFLRELEDRKQRQTEDEENSDGKLTFQKSVIAANKLETVEEDKPVFKSSTLVMPEYIIGQRKKKEKKNVQANKEKRVELKLDHLLENEEDE